MTCLSILMPTFNGAAFLERQVASIVAQSWGDFELLIHDDGSSDGTPDMIRNAASADRRIKPSFADKNAGQAESLRLLLSRANGNLIAFSDQDDLWAEGKLQALLDALGSAAAAYGTSVLIDENDEELGRNLFDHVGAPIDGRNRIRPLFSNTVSGHALLLRRSILHEGAFRTRPMFDALLAAAASFAGGLVYVPTAVTRHRIHSTNQVNRIGLREHRSIGRSEKFSEIVEGFRFLADHPALPPTTRVSLARISTDLGTFSDRGFPFRIRALLAGRNALREAGCAEDDVSFALRKLSSYVFRSITPFTLPQDRGARGSENASKTGGSA